MFFRYRGEGGLKLVLTPNLCERPPLDADSQYHR
jgi:hypothetical protein